MNSKTIILGCGITGLIATHLLEDAICIEAGDEVCKDFKDGTFPKFLKESPQIDSVYKSIDYDFMQPFMQHPVDEHHKKLYDIMEPFNVEIFDDGSMFGVGGGVFVGFYIPHNKETKEKIYKNYCIKKYGVVKEGKMNGYMETNSQIAYYKNKDKLIEKLYEINKDRIKLNSKVTCINPFQKKIWIGEELYNYDTLVSTLPIPIFNKLTGMNLEYNTLNIKSIDVTFKKPLADWMADFTYISDPNYGFHRITKSCDSKTLSFEVLDNLEEYNNNHLQFINKFICTVDAIEDITEKHFKFPIASVLPKFDDLYYIGRFAIGNYNVKVEDTIDEINSIKTLIRNSA